MKKESREELLLQRLLDRVGRLLFQMEKLNLAEYLQLLDNPRRFLLVNFLGGVARGVGFTLGATLLGALVLYFLQRLVVLNLPIIGTFIAELVKIIRQHL